MNYIGFDKDGEKLRLGDICSFKLDKKDYEGVIMYDQDVFSYVFEMENDKLPTLVMSKADLNSIQKIIGIYSTQTNDRFEFYREVYKNMLNN